MAKSHTPPANPSRQYLLDVAWLKAFRDCGFSGKRALAAADKAVTQYEKTLIS